MAYTTQGTAIVFAIVFAVSTIWWAVDKQWRLRNRAARMQAELDKLYRIAYGRDDTT